MTSFTDEEREEALKRRLAGAPLMANGLPSGGSLKFVSTGESSTTDSGPTLENYIEADSFQGTKEGYVFKMGSYGLGYYVDGGPMNVESNGNAEQSTGEYDMEKHILGIEDESARKPPEPGEGRVGALGDLLAENKRAKQEAFEKMVHDNRFQAPRALDEDEVAFINEKETERQWAKRLLEEEEKQAQDEFKRAQAEAIKEPEEKKVDLAKLMGQAKPKKKEDNTHKLLSRLVAPKRKEGGNAAPAPAEKKAKVEDTAGGLMGLAAYDDSDEDD